MTETKIAGVVSDGMDWLADREQQQIFDKRKDATFKAFKEANPELNDSQIKIICASYVRKDSGLESIVRFKGDGDAIDRKKSFEAYGTAQKHLQELTKDGVQHDKKPQVIPLFDLNRRPIADSKEIAALAQRKDEMGLAVRYALKEGNPYAVLGVDYKDPQKLLEMTPDEIKNKADLLASKTNAAERHGSLEHDGPQHTKAAQSFPEFRPDQNQQFGR
jgi:hypothetical protein